MNHQINLLLRPLILSVLFSLAWFSVGCTSLSKVSPSDEVVSKVNDFQSQDSSSEDKSTDNIDEIQSERILSPGYLFRLSQIEDEKLNGKFRMDFDGNLRLPYNVSVAARGLTMPELRRRVEDAYKTFFKSSAPMEIRLVDSTYWIEVQGIVKKPGRFLVRKSTSLEEVLFMAGGLNSGSTDEGYVKVIQGKSIFAIDLEQYFDTGKRVRKIDWKGGDLLFFQRELDPDDVANSNIELQKTIKLLGEVRKPGDIAYRKNADFYYYLSKAGGPTATADMNKISIIRGKDNERKAISFSGENAEAIPRMEEGDMLLVNADKPSLFQKFVTTSSSVMTIVSSLALLVLALQR